MSLDEQLQRNIARRRKSESSPYGYGLTSKKIAALQEAGQDPLVQFYASVGCVFRSTSAYLDHLARDVRECKSVNEANNFCRWLFQFRTGRAQEKYASSDIAEIMRKLDVLLSDRAKPVLPAPVSDEVCLTQELQSLGRSANSNNLGALAPDERSEAQAKE